MIGEKSQLLIGLGMGFIALFSVPVLAGSINLEEAGTPFWILTMWGAVIIICQLFPSIFIFLALISTLSLMILEFRRVLTPAKKHIPYYPATVIRRNRRRTDTWEF